MQLLTLLEANIVLKWELSVALLIKIPTRRGTQRSIPFPAYVVMYPTTLYISIVLKIAQKAF